MFTIRRPHIGWSAAVRKGYVKLQVVFTYWAVAADMGWVMFYDRTSYSYRNVPKACGDKIAELFATCKQFKDIAFSASGGWVVLHDSSAAWRGVPDSLDRKMRELCQAGRTLKQVAFAPNGGWAVLHDGGAAWNGVPDDCVSC